MANIMNRERALQYLSHLGHSSRLLLRDNYGYYKSPEEISLKGDRLARGPVVRSPEPETKDETETVGDAEQGVQQSSLSVYTSCTCGSSLLLMQQAHLCVNVDDNSDSDNEEGALALDKMLLMIGRFERNPQLSSAARMNLLRLASSLSLPTNSSISEHQINQLSTFLASDHYSMVEVCLKVIERLLTLTACCQSLSQRLDLLDRVIEMSTDTSFSFPETQAAALQVLEKLLSTPEFDYKVIWEKLDKTVYPVVVHIMHSRGAHSELKLAACCVLRTLAREAHFAMRVKTDSLFLLQQLRVSGNAYLWDVIVGVLMALYSHPGLTEAGGVDTGVLSIVRDLLKDGPCMSQRQAFDLLSSVVCDGHSAEAMAEDKRIVAYTLACLLKSRCRKVRAGAAVMCSILTSVRKKSVAQKVMEGASHYVQPETLFQVAVGGGLVTKMASPAPGKHMLEARLWYNMDCVLDALSELIHSEAFLEMDSRQLISDLPVKGQISPVQLSCLTRLVQVVANMCAWPLQRPALDQAKQLSKEGMLQLCDSEDFRRRYTMLNHKLAMEQWNRFGPSMFAIFRWLSQRISSHVQSKTPPEFQPKSARPVDVKIEDILSDPECELLTALLHFTCGISIVTCKHIENPLIKVYGGAGDAEKEPQLKRSSSASDTAKDGDMLERKAVSERLAVRRGLYSEGLFQILSCLLKLADPEVKKLCSIVLRTLVQPITERQLASSIRSEMAVKQTRPQSATAALNQSRPQSASRKTSENKISIALHRMSPASAAVVKDALDLHSDSSTSIATSQCSSSASKTSLHRSSPSLSARPPSRSRPHSTVNKFTPIRPKQLLAGQPISRECQREAVSSCGADMIRDLFSRYQEVKKSSLVLLHDIVKYATTDVLMQLSKLGMMSKLLDFVRVNDDDETLVVIGLVVAEMLIQSEVRLKQLFLRHGGHNLLMALTRHPSMYIRAQVCSILAIFRRVRSDRGKKQTGQQRPLSAPVTTQTKVMVMETQPEDIWDHIMQRWQKEDRVVEVLQKFL